MDGQIGLFEWRPEALPGFPDINDISEAEAIKIIGEQIGVKFAYNKMLEYWEGKVGKLKLSIEYDHYVIGNRSLFLSAGWQKGTSGGGAPCDSIEETILWMQRVMQC